VLNSGNGRRVSPSKGCERGRFKQTLSKEVACDAATRAISGCQASPALACERYHAVMSRPASPLITPVGRAVGADTGAKLTASLFTPLLIMLVAALLALAFAKLGSEVMEGETRSFDSEALQMAGLLRSSCSWLTSVMRDLSGMGSTVVLSLVTTATVGYLALVNARTTAVVVASAVVSGTLLVSVFKAAFGRLRPDIAFAALQESSLSFPSGHASMSAIVYLTLGALIASTRRRWSQRLYILLIATLMTALVGVSRVALGVHWATDVLGGWAFGAAWAMVWLVLAQYMARRGPSTSPDAPL
jgi:undecaprenyl-diphosphatase